MKKRGQGLSTNAIILIVLGVVVLAMLIFGFTLGWAKLAPWISTNNVNTISDVCSIACSTHSQYDFCAVKRTIDDGVNKPVEDTCNNFAKDGKYTDRSYGIDKCQAITCK